jgi:hypothetical protein
MLKRFTAKVVTVQGSLPETINPCVVVPADIVRALRSESKKNQSIPVTGTLQGKRFEANVVRYRGAWRLYLNGSMRKAAGVEPGDRAAVTLGFDPRQRTVPVPPAFARALAANRKAKAAFAALAPSRRKEILRYLGNLKREESLMRNVAKAVRSLCGARPETVPVALRQRR